MTKKCSFDGCNEEIQQWQSFCSRHYQTMMAQQSPALGGAVVEEPPQIPVQKVALQKPSLPKGGVSQIDTPTNQLTPQVSSNQPIQRHEQVETGDKDRYFLRKECLKSAVDLICQTDIENKSFDVLMGEIETLTEKLYGLVTKK